MFLCEASAAEPQSLTAAQPRKAVRPARSVCSWRRLRRAAEHTALPLALPFHMHMRHTKEINFWQDRGVFSPTTRELREGRHGAEASRALPLRATLLSSPKTRIDFDAKKSSPTRRGHSASRSPQLESIT